MDVLNELARIIRNDPSLSVKEIAKRLGYSEQKSVYYWLQKTRWKGIKAFKRAVLTGEYASRTKTARILKESKGRTVIEVPVARGFAEEGFPNFEQDPAIVTARAGSSAYGIIVDGDRYYPWVFPGDLLVVDPDALVQEGDLVALLSPERDLILAYVARIAGRASQELHLDIKNPAKTAGRAEPYLRRLGKVMQLVRDFDR
jgi:SOS-response transcriptional repressor LexA